MATAYSMPTDVSKKPEQPNKWTTRTEVRQWPDPSTVDTVTASKMSVWTGIQNARALARKRSAPKRRADHQNAVLTASAKGLLQ